ncbi:MAG TPA: pilus assembly protein [Gammaproteobacteria bacterium]|nr:pilus assembly protein [Gammaproteobacteria bacterium]|tara:strand:+ start:51 stop:479 length:429 start_codon:yes stop_codon:yes gene_type:complete
MKRHIMKNNKNRGMTLAELLIMVIIVATLASFVLPSWNSQVKTARRADARNSLIFVQVEQERYRSSNGRYASSMSALGLSSYNSTSRDYYSISIVSSGEAAFVASATPNTNGAQDSDLCGTFAVDQFGPNESGVYASISKCW